MVVRHAGDPSRRDRMHSRLRQKSTTASAGDSFHRYQRDPPCAGLQRHPLQKPLARLPAMGATLRVGGIFTRRIFKSIESNEGMDRRDRRHRDCHPNRAIAPRHRPPRLRRTQPLRLCPNAPGHRRPGTMAQKTSSNRARPIDRTDRGHRQRILAAAMGPALI